MSKEPPIAPSAAQVSVIVIGFNDAEHIADAVLSALRQGTPVAEVIAVDDASTDRTPEVLAELAARHARIRVIRRTTNSGGCGSPRNDGLRAATAPYVMFLDSDDVLEPGAAEALFTAADRHGAQVVAGRSVRRELPQGRDVPWQSALFVREAVYASPAGLPRMVRDTLCVNKLYDRAFLSEHSIAFPEGAFRYEDFVFTARVLAAGPRIALIPDTVYIWHVRRAAQRASISLARDDIGNWRGRLAAHRLAVETFEEAGQKLLAHAAQVKFLDHDLRMYVRELGTRSPGHRAEWWRLTRAHLAPFDVSVLRAARAPARWIARVVLASAEPRDLGRLAELANRPARLLPPYARVAGRPVWDVDLPEVELDGIDTKPLHRLPVLVEAEPRLAGRARPSLLRVTVRVHELYGRLAAAHPLTADVELRHRGDGRLGMTRDAALNPGPSRTPGGASGAGPATWTAEALVNLGALASAGSAEMDVWDIRVRVRFADDLSLYAAARAVGPGLRRLAVPDRRHGLVLAQPHATTGGSLALRVAAGPRAAAGVAARRLRRLRRAWNR
ncbi:glycosyltransferase [Streptomyces pathocidini]|uniref:Glycosyltransferase n=1 Tax=Streptomyces pathocidini TaxID=1650571 RepID=A0ABW7UTM2_9ACTN|nr:glycosyltransferase family 2 protein [Streptomyces pathocidini]